MKRMNSVRQVAGDEFNMSDDAPVFLRRRLFLGKPENQGGAMIVVEISKPYKKDFDVACRVCIKGYRKEMHEIFGIDDIDAVKNAYLFVEKYSRGAITYIGRMDPVMDSHIFNPNPHDLAITI